MKIRLNNKDIKIGQAIAWNLYNIEGRVLFKCGLVVNTEVALNKIYSLELYRDTDEAGIDTQQYASQKQNPSTQTLGSQAEIPSQHNAAVASRGDHFAMSSAELSSEFVLDDSDNVIENINSYAVFLKGFYESVGSGDGTLVAGLATLVKHIIRITDSHPDQCLAAIHLYYRLPQSLLQPIYAAVLCKVLSDLAYIETDHVEPLLSAALTANIGMYQYYDKLVANNGKLAPQQQVLINTHPLRSVMLLKSAGLTNRMWLEVVAQHHERGDGSGYPKGLKRDEIRVEASIYGLADSYLSMIMPRAFRPRVEPLVAWQRLAKFNVADDDEILRLFLKFASIYPPGSVVELKNNEIALVLKRGKEGITPTVVAFGDSKGNSHKDMKIRHTDQDEHGIVGAFIGQLPVNADLLKIYMIARGISSAVKT